jgi:gliding motility-associated-like protein
MLIAAPVVGQQHFGQFKRCGTDERHEQLMQDPAYAEAWHERQHKFRFQVLSQAQQTKDNCDEPFFIPVAVHFQNMPNMTMQCAIDMAVDQVRILNEDFAATNADISNWNNLKPTVWPNINNDQSCIQFCLATLNHPAGFGLNNGDYAVTLNQTTGDNNPQWAGYINFWVRPLGNSVLGYSPLGGNANGDGVTCTPTAFSSISCGGNTLMGQYNLGRTITHEIGHYFNLKHPFDTNGGCADAVNDGVDDTPRTDTETYGCPINNPNFVNCTDPVLWPSYMDYCDDACLFMFSAGQVNRMRAWYDANLANAGAGAVTKCQDAACAGFKLGKTVVNESCGGNDGEIKFNITGGTAPFLYSINNGSTLQNSPDFLALSKGKYYLYVRDAQECELRDSVIITRDKANLAILDLKNAFCGDNSGYVEVAVDYADDFEYNITGSPGWRTNPLFENLTPGPYTITARNATDCTGTISFTIGDDTDLNLVVQGVRQVNCPLADNGQVIATLSNGAEPFEFRLNGERPQPTGQYNGLGPGKYSLTVVDSRNCRQRYDFELGVSFLNIAPDCPCQLFAPNAFTPDGDGLNDLWKAIPSCPVSDYHLRIFDRWGGLLFETIDQNKGWNGGWAEYYAEPGIYMYRVTFRWGENDNESLEVQTKSGIIHLIR